MRGYDRTTNRYPGRCYVCSTEVPAGRGYYVRGMGTVHLACYMPAGSRNRLAAHIDRGQREGDRIAATRAEAACRALVAVLLAPRAGGSE